MNETISEINEIDATEELPSTTTNKENEIGIKITDVKQEEVLSKSEIEKKLEELGEYDPTLELSQYKMPGMDLLNDYGDGKIEVDKADLEDKKNRIVETLGHYKIGIASISMSMNMHLAWNVENVL